VSRRVRDTILFLAGLAGIGYETVFQKVDRPELLVLFAGMVGLPIFFRSDDYRRGYDDRDTDDGALSRRRQRGTKNAP